MKPKINSKILVIFLIRIIDWLALNIKPWLIQCLTMKTWSKSLENRRPIRLRHLPSTAEHLFSTRIRTEINNQPQRTTRLSLTKKPWTSFFASMLHMKFWRMVRSNRFWSNARLYHCPLLFWSENLRWRKRLRFGSSSVSNVCRSSIRRINVYWRNGTISCVSSRKVYGYSWSDRSIESASSISIDHENDQWRE